MDNLKTGDKVICVSATGYLVEGETYTVKHTYGGVTSHNAITVNECSVKKGFEYYKIDRFEKVQPPNLVAISIDDLETILDAFIALDYYSEGTYINMSSYSRVVDKIEGQIKTNEN
tara:strand:- start:8588 stop:8935 length:348 start_codon:yes stop_codon:yes gene_type:complete